MQAKGGGGGGGLEGGRWTAGVASRSSNAGFPYQRDGRLVSRPSAVLRCAGGKARNATRRPFATPFCTKMTL